MRVFSEIRITLVVLMLSGLFSCSQYRKNEFTSCEDYSPVKFSSPQAKIPLYYPQGWETLPDVLAGDTLRIDSSDPEQSNRGMKLLQMPSENGYRNLRRFILDTRGRDKSADLIMERGLLRLEGKALEYYIENDNLYSYIYIPLRTEGYMVLITGYISRKDAPELNDFCYLGPVLVKMIRTYKGPQS